MGSELLWYRIEDQAIARLAAVERLLEQAIAERASKANRNGVSRDYAGPAVDLLAAQKRELEQIIKDAETNAFRSVQGENIPDPTDALRALVSAPVPTLSEILASTGTPELVPEPSPPATAAETVRDDAPAGPTLLLNKKLVLMAEW